VHHEHHHRPHSADEWARLLEDPERDAWQKPREVVISLDIKPADVVADIGAGSGYFTRRLARHAATVYAVDTDEKLLAMASKGAPDNVRTILADPNDPRLPENSVDLIFICDVLHHVENRPEYYRKLLKALKPGGRIVNIDFFKKPLPVGPRPEMKLSEEHVESEFQAAGMRLVTKRLHLLPYQYYLVFTRASDE